jgi:hypothetical protein
MIITRRSLLGGILAAAAGPAIVRADSLMKIFVPSREIVSPISGRPFVFNRHYFMMPTDILHVTFPDGARHDFLALQAGDVFSSSDIVLGENFIRLDRP